jgi:hypothetical protein
VLATFVFRGICLKVEKSYNGLHICGYTLSNFFQFLSISGLGLTMFATYSQSMGEEEEIRPDDPARV